MPQSDVLNPTPHHPLNPDYSFQKKRPVTHLNAKANRGIPYFRDLTDVGHSFMLNWMDRPVETADELKRYYEQYLDGFFTYIDHEGGGRQYVGHFVSPVEPVPTQHGHWSIQQVQFDEIPTVPMLKYPHRWDKDAIWALLVDDYGDCMTMASGAWTFTPNSAAASKYEFQGANGNTADWTAYQYKGYGFQFWARTGPGLGIGQLSIDGAVLGNVDFYSAAASATAVKLYDQANSLNVPLGVHVVQLTATNTKNSASTGYTILWDALKVMR